jgi:hypothetical protein
MSSGPSGRVGNRIGIVGICFSPMLVMSSTIPTCRSVNNSGW